METEMDITGKGVSMDALNNLGDAFDSAIDGTDLNAAENAGTTDNENTGNTNEPNDNSNTESARDEGSTQTYDGGDELGADVFNEPTQQEQYANADNNTDNEKVEGDDSTDNSKEEEPKTEPKTEPTKDPEESSSSDEKSKDEVTKPEDEENEVTNEYIEELITQGDEVVKNPTVKVKTRNYVNRLRKTVIDLQEKVDSYKNGESPESAEVDEELMSKYEDLVKENTKYRRKLQIENNPILDERFDSKKSVSESRIEKILKTNKLPTEEAFETDESGDKIELLSLAMIKKEGGIKKYFDKNPDIEEDILSSLPSRDAFLVRQELAKQEEIEFEKQEYIESIASDDDEFEKVANQDKRVLIEGVEESVKSFESQQFIQEIDIDKIEDEADIEKATQHNELAKNLKGMYKQTLNDIVEQKADVAEIAQVAVTSYFFKNKLDQAIEHINKQNDVIENLKKADGIKLSGSVRNSGGSVTKPKTDPTELANMSLDQAFDATSDEMFS